MALTANKLTKQVDLPVWEWTRPLPVTPSGGLQATCVADNPIFNETSGRYIYMLLNATNFWRYDTIADTYQQLSSPPITVNTASSMRFAGAQGYYGRAISSTSTTLTTGLPFGKQAIGYRIRIISGKGMGQERLITDVSDPIIADFGGASGSGTTSLTDSSKNWGYNGTTNNVNNWVGYVVRIVGGTGINTVRKILYNSATVLTIADNTILAWDTWAYPSTSGATSWSLGVGSLYQIESSTITVDTAWTVQPDDTSRYVIQSGGIWLSSGSASTGFTMQYYSVLEDVWYLKPGMSNMVPFNSPSENALERLTENSTLWYTGKATSGNTTSLSDSAANWRTNQWAGYEIQIWTGTGLGQVAIIANNTTNTLNFSSTLSTGLDSTSRYNITGYDGGTLTSSTGRIVVDSSKSWTVNRWTNYSIRIVGGKGIGQLRNIISNGTNSLVLNDPWNIQPDNTSNYIIQANSTDLYLNIGGSGELYIYHTGDSDLVSHGRILDEGTIQVACAIPTDGTDTTTHEIQERKPIAIASLSGTTTITATTTAPHQLKVGQWVSIRGVTSAAADVYNVTGKVQIVTVPTTTTFTYTPFAAGSGTYAYSSGAVVGVTVLPDASKYHADLATGGSTTTVTFSRAQPSNINGWYVYGTNIGAGAQIVSGAGTTTLTLNIAGAGTPSGTIIITKWPQPVTATYSSGGGAGVFNATMTGNIPAYVKGWLATGTNIGLSAIVTGGEGTNTPLFSIQCAGTPSGTITFSSPANNLLPETATYSSGTGTSITMSGSVPNYIRGWFVSGTNIANGTTVTGGEGTATITLSTATSGTPSGTITFYPPSVGLAMYYGVSGNPSITTAGMNYTGNPMQLVAQNTNNGTIMTPLTSISGVSAGTSKYLITRRDMIGQNYEGQNINYLSGVALGTQSITTLVDTNSFWATATGSGGSAGATSFTISAPGSPIHNGWFVSGTNIPTGARVVSGGGTTTITIDTPLTGVVSGTITFTAWSTNLLISRRVRVISSTGVNQEVAITAVTPSTGTLTFASITAAGSGTSSYTILPTVATGQGSTIQWVSDSSVSAANKGRNIFRFRGGATSGVDKFDLTTDRYTVLYSIPIQETLSSGTMYAYDQLDRIYFTKDVTNRVYYLDCNTLTIHGAGLFPYLTGTASVGNLMEVFQTTDGLKYLWVNRKLNVETFRQLIFY